PFFLTSLRELVVGRAAPTRREHELRRHAERRPIARHAQLEPVEVAINCQLRVDASAARTGLNGHAGQESGVRNRSFEYTSLAVSRPQLAAGSGRGLFAR